MRHEQDILVPARMMNEYVYCPRLAYLEWVQGEWADSSDTVEGSWAHRNVDVPGKRRRRSESDAREEAEVLELRSVLLSSDRLGMIAKIDLLEETPGSNRVVPVDYKTGKRPHVAKGAWEPERVQLCAQGMLLEEHGYQCDEGILYFAGSRERVHIPFDAELRALTLDVLQKLQDFLHLSTPPPPLEDSPKCVRCSLNPICLPEETIRIASGRDVPRRILPRKEDALPLHVQEPGARIHKSGGVLEISVDGEKRTSVRLEEVSHVALYGPVHITVPAIHELLRRGIGISYHTMGGWFLGQVVGSLHSNVELRTAQYRKSFHDETCLWIARSLVAAKIANCRTLLRRNWRLGEKLPAPLAELSERREGALKAKDIQTLLGVEGAAAGAYFKAFTGMLRDEVRSEFVFDFNGRKRRPPPDPVNAMLSFAYAMLTREWTTVLTCVGFDPYRGFYHQPRFGRPALALDMMEPFRPLVADSVLLTALNNGELKRSDFAITPFGCTLKKQGRRRFIKVFERRMAQEITHPIFGYRISYRRLFEVEARLLGRFLTGEIPEYPGFTTR